MKRPRTLASIDKYPRVKEFLSDVSRNSIRSARTYNYALEHLATFLQIEYKQYDIETVLDAITKDKIDVYSLLNRFVGYLMLRQDASNSNARLAPSTIKLFYAGVESYLANNDIYISRRKAKQKIRLPKKYKVNKQPLSPKTIQDILLSCTHDTLKSFLLVIGSSGLRSTEALSLRNSDIDFSTVPTTIHIRAQISKTKQENYIYISDEATKELKRFILSKYSAATADEYKKYPNHLVFSKEIYNEKIEPINIYRMLHSHFIKLLKKVDKDTRRDGQATQRRDIHFHLFRTFVYTTISNTGKDQYAKWMLSNSNSTYWASPESERRKIYLEVMRYLTFLDITTVEAVGADYLSKLEEKDAEIYNLEQNLIWQEDRFTEFEDDAMKFRDDISKRIQRIAKNMGITDTDKKKGKVKK